MTGTSAHVADGPLQQGGKLGLFLRGETGDDARFVFLNGAMHQVMTFPALGQHQNPLEPPVIGIGLQPDEALLLQPGQNSGNGWVGQLEFHFHIPGAGGLGLMHQIGHDAALGSSQFHVFQRIGHSLIGIPLEKAKQISVAIFQKEHLQNKNVARYLLV